MSPSPTPTATPPSTTTPQGALAAESDWTGDDPTSEEDYGRQRRPPAGTSGGTCSTPGPPTVTAIMTSIQLRRGREHHLDDRPARVTARDHMADLLWTSASCGRRTATASSGCSCQQAGPTPVAPGGVITPPSSAPPPGVTVHAVRHRRQRAVHNDRRLPARRRQRLVPADHLPLFKGNSVTLHGTNIILHHHAAVAVAAVRDDQRRRGRHPARLRLRRGPRPPRPRPTATARRSPDHLRLRRRRGADQHHLTGREPVRRQRRELHHRHRLQRRRREDLGHPGRRHRRHRHPAHHQLRLRRRRQPDHRPGRPQLYHHHQPTTPTTRPPGHRPRRQRDPDLLRRRRQHHPDRPARRCRREHPDAGILPHHLPGRVQRPARRRRDHRHLRRRRNQTTATTTPAPAGQTGYETTTYTYDGDGNLIETTAPPTSNRRAPNQVTIRHL